MRRTFLAAVVLALGLALVTGRASGATAVSYFDQAFGNAGQAALGMSGSYWEAGLVQGDGEPVAVGSDGANLLLARYTTGGALDSTFGSDGVVATTAPGADAVAYTVIPDGDQFLVAGTDVSSTTHANVVLVARYNSDGSLDTTFGTNGFYTGNLPGVVGGDAGFALAIQSTGRIVVLADNLDASSQQMWGLIGLDADGTVDTSFGTNGMFWTSTGGSDFGAPFYAAYGLLVEPDDELVAAGDSIHEMALWKFTADGSFDTTFGTGGRAQGFSESVGNDPGLSVVRQTDGSLVVGGGRDLGTNAATSDETFALERFTSSGHLDSSFGSGGLVETQIGSKDDEIEGLSQAPDGDLVAVGFSGFPVGDSSYPQFAAARYSQDGVLDTAFGKNGLAVTPGGGIWVGAAVDSDGRIYAFGDDSDSAVVGRYLGGLRPLAASPATGVVGDTVHLTGPDMSVDDTVKIGNLTVPGGDVTNVSPTAIDVTVPPGAVTGKISVATPAGTATTPASFAVLPAVTSLNSTGPFTTAQTLGITGETLTGVKSVTVGGVAWRFKVDSDSHITATAPAGAVSGVLALVNLGGTTQAGSITIAPVAARLSPTTGTANGVVTITGSGLAGATASFNGVAATVKSSTATRLVVLVPPTATVGTIGIVATDALTTSTAASFKPVPKIASVTQGREGDQVTIVGTNLGSTTSVSLGGLAASDTPISGLSLTATVPASSKGAWTIVTPGGRAASKLWYAAPTISSFGPASGPVRTTVTIHGLDFAGTTKVLFGATKAAFKLVSASEITVAVPVGAATAQISVTNRGGTTTSAGTFTVT